MFSYWYCYLYYYCYCTTVLLLLIAVVLLLLFSYPFDRTLLPHVHLATAEEILCHCTTQLQVFLNLNTLVVSRDKLSNDTSHDAVCHILHVGRVTRATHVNRQLRGVLCIFHNLVERGQS